MHARAREHARACSWKLAVFLKRGLVCNLCRVRIIRAPLTGAADVDACIEHQTRKKMDPNEVSGDSDPESDVDIPPAESDDDYAACGQLHENAQGGDDDGDDDDVGSFAWKASRGGALTQSGRDDDEGEEVGVDDDDDDDDLRGSAQPKPAVQRGLDAFLVKPKPVVPLGSTKKPAKTAKATKPVLKNKALPAPQPVTPRINNGAPKSKSKEPQRTFNANSDDSDDGGLSSLTVPKKDAWPMPARDRDVVQEFDEKMAKPTLSESAPKVCDSALAPHYVMKNEKTNKWFRVDSSALVYAPKLVTENLLCFSMDDITFPSKPARDAMQGKLVREQCAKVASTLMAFKIAPDGNASATSATSATSVMVVVPYLLMAASAEMECLRTLLKADETQPIVGILALGVDAIKDAYAAKVCALPSQYDPTKPVAGTKHKWPSKLDEYASHDDNFKLLGPLEKARRSQKRADDSLSKADAKKPRASAEATRESPATNGADGDVAQAAGTSREASPIPNVVEMPCAKGEKLTLVACPETGRYFLVRTPK